MTLIMMISTGQEGTSVVAVKTLKESAGDKERQELLKELQVMKNLKPHQNLVQLIGCCTDKGWNFFYTVNPTHNIPWISKSKSCCSFPDSDPVFIIMEFVNGGKLQSYLRKSRAEHYYGNLHSSSSHLSSRDLTSFAYQIARAMEYLANKEVNIFFTLKAVYYY